MKKIQLPLTMEDRRSLRAGEQVLLSGVIYTARDAAHKRMKELLDAGAPVSYTHLDVYKRQTGASGAASGQ